MKNYSKHIPLVIAILFSTLFISCNESDLEPEIINDSAEGFFIVNEGAWGNGNASLSFLDLTNNTISNDIYYNANDQKDLGDQAQSMTIYQSKGYIVVQNSGKIEVISADSLKSIATITEEIESPRYFVGYSNSKGYVSDWGDGFSGSVKVIDLGDYSVTKTIPVGMGPNRMLVDGDQLYVVNAGGFGRDNKLVIIDTNTDEVIQNIEIADNPNSLQQDAEDNLWVLASGHTAFDESFNVVAAESTNGSLTKISSDGTIQFKLAFSDLLSPNHLSINNEGTSLYYLYNSAIYEMSTDATELPNTALVDKNYYGLAINPTNGNIIGCEAPDFSTSGNIDLYDTNGTLLSTYKVGIAPNGCAFR